MRSIESNKKDFKETDVWDSEDDDWGDEIYTSTP